MTRSLLRPRCLGICLSAAVGAVGAYCSILRSLSGKITQFEVPGSGRDDFIEVLNDDGEATGAIIDAKNRFHGFIRTK